MPRWLRGLVPVPVCSEQAAKEGDCHRSGVRRAGSTRCENLGGGARSGHPGAQRLARQRRAAASHPVALLLLRLSGQAEPSRLASCRSGRVLLMIGFGRWNLRPDSTSSYKPGPVQQGTSFKK